MRFLVAFDKFKDAMSAEQACMAAASAIGGEVDLCPLTDGGEGFAGIITRAAGGTLSQVPVSGPRGGQVAGHLGLVSAQVLSPEVRNLLDFPFKSDGMLAVIDMASASGLALLAHDQRDPWQVDSRGTGELIRAAANAGVSGIILGLGGSATHDLSLGALVALGLEPRTRDGRACAPAPINWAELASFSGMIDPRLPVIRMACDVANPLLGPKGAVSVYAPQKGLRPVDAAKLERATFDTAQKLCAHFNADLAHTTQALGAGAAGGMAFGLTVAVGARVVSGSKLVVEWLGLEQRISAADIVLTGEGRFDHTSLAGKGPGSVATRALELGKIVHVFAGVIEPGLEEHLPARLNLHALSPPGLPIEQALREASERLTTAVAVVAASGW